MEVAAEIRPVLGHNEKAAKAAGTSGGGADGLLYGKIKLAGLNPKLIPAIPSPEKFKASPHYPLYFTNSPFLQQTVDGESSIDANLPGINGGPMDFETAAAKGRMQVHIRGVKSTRAGVFDGKKRFVHVAVQVRVKRPLAVSSVCIGQELYNDVAIPLWMRQVLLGTAAKAFSSTARVEADGTPRYFMNPVLAACQLVNVALPGQDPDIWDCREDVRLLLPACADKDGRPLPAERRRKWCDVEANVAGAALVPDHVYTFHFWQHYANFGDYKLSLGFLNLDLAMMQNRCPLGLTVRDVDSGEYVFSLLAWHERLLYGAASNALADGGGAAAAAEQQLGGGVGGMGARLLSGVGRVLGGGGGGK